MTDNGRLHPPAPSGPGDAAPMSVGPWIGRAIAATAHACAQRPLLTVAVSAILAVVCLAYALHTLTFVTDPLRLLPQREHYVKLLREYQDDFGELNDIVVVLESRNPDQSKDYAARLRQALAREGLAPSRLSYRVDPAYFDHRALLYLSVGDLTKLRDRLFDYQEFIEGYAARPTLPQLLDGLNQQIANGMAVGLFDLGLAGEQSTDLRFLDAVLGQISARLDGTSKYTSPWAAAFSVSHLDDPDVGYYFSSDRQWLFVFVRVDGDIARDGRTIKVIRRTITDLQREFPDVRAGVTGGPAISHDEMTTAFDDSKLATILAFTLTLVLLVGAFRRFLKPPLILVTLVISLAWSLGIIALVVGHLSIFSVMFISIVVGIGTDYGIYFLYRYEEERSREGRPAGAIRRTGERAGPGIMLGALSATGAFAVLMLSDFQGIREFGFVSATAILLSVVAMITLFPALLALADRRQVVPAPATTAPAALPAAWLERVIRYRRTILVGALALTAFAIWSAVRVNFDYNMLKLQAKGVESVEWEERILAQAGRSGFSALATASSVDELRRKQEAFAALPSVSRVESVLMLAPDHQEEKVKLVQQFAPLVAPVRVAAVTGVTPDDLRAPLETLARRLKIMATEGGGSIKSQVRPLQAKVQAILDKLDHADPRTTGPALEQLQGRMARDFAAKLASFQKSLNPRLVKPGDAPPDIKRRYIGASGRYLLRIQPAVDIWQQEGAERFVTDLRSVDPDVTGPPVTSFEAIRFIRHAYFQGTLYALVLVTVLTAAILRSVRATALALSPLGLGILWTLGLMHVFGLEFNLANVWALPMIIGTAAEFGLNIFVRFQEGRDTGGTRLAQSTVMAVVLNGFTTMAGFSSLMVAHHRGIFGLGLLLTLGMVTSLFASLAVLPVLLKMFYGPGTPGPARIRESRPADLKLPRERLPRAARATPDATSP